MELRPPGAGGVSIPCNVKFDFDERGSISAMTFSSFLGIQLNTSKQFTLRLKESPPSAGHPADKIVGAATSAPGTVSSGNDASGLDDPQRAWARMFSALVESNAQRETDERERQYQALRHAINEADKCPHYGGAGAYRYVDAAGMLQSRQCPSCAGSGKAF